MKKLMIGLVGVAALVACANELASANIVGFEDRGLVKGEKVITGANFVNVGTETLDLQSIKMDATTGDGGAQIWWWNNQTGKYDADAYWYTCLYDNDGNELNISGWGDFDNWVAIDKKFTIGESFWIQAGEAASVAFSGEVTTIDSTVESVGIDLTMGQKVQMTNPFPQELNLQSIKMDAATGDGGAQIWWWNNQTGKYDADAYWYTCLYDDEGNELNISGWGDFDNWVAIDKTFESGFGFWIQAGADATVLFPNPFYVVQ